MAPITLPVLALALSFSHFASAAPVNGSEILSSLAPTQLFPNMTATSTATASGQASSAISSSPPGVSAAPLRDSVPLSYNSSGPQYTSKAPTPTSLPSGGVETSPDDVPKYKAETDFDFQSFNLALHQEWIELDLFHWGLATFSEQEFEEAGIDAEGRFLIQFMADQEVGHANLITNIVGKGKAPVQCSYQYPASNVREWLDFSQKLTRFGESGVYGFLGHLKARDAATLLLQSITTEARQQMTFRQLEGAFPYPVYFEAGIPQAFAWTLLSPFIKSCPATNPPIGFQIFPALDIINNPSILSLNKTAAVTHNSTALTAPGRKVEFNWEKPGAVRGPYHQTTKGSDKPAKYALWVSQLNATYTPLEEINGTYAFTYQPNGTIFDNVNYGVVNDTVFIALTDSNPYVTSFNLSLVNPHVVAGPALYSSG